MEKNNIFKELLKRNRFIKKKVKRKERISIILGICFVSTLFFMCLFNLFRLDTWFALPFAVLSSWILYYKHYYEYLTKK